MSAFRQAEGDGAIQRREGRSFLYVEPAADRDDVRWWLFCDFLPSGRAYAAVECWGAGDGKEGGGEGGDLI